jgi:hypothetical protein
VDCDGGAGRGVREAARGLWLQDSAGVEGDWGKLVILVGEWAVNVTSGS